MWDIVGKRNYFFLLSALIIVPGAISLLLPGGLRPGIDFTSGSIMTVKFEKPVASDALRGELATLGHPEAIVQLTGSGDYIVRTRVLLPESKEASGTTKPSERATIEKALRDKFGALQVLGFDEVSPIIATEVIKYSIIAVAAACAGILLYLWFAFRKIEHSWRYGACAVAALIHDSLVVLGTFSILGRMFDIEVDAMFITAVLTVIGFSVHDTIVVFDRVRENLLRHAGVPFEEVVNHSLMQTMARSLNTSLTVLLTLLTLRLFGGVTIHSFVLALLIGITAGTYSSIFNASLLLVVWEKGDLGRLIRRLQPA